MRGDVRSKGGRTQQRMVPKQNAYSMESSPPFHNDSAIPCSGGLLFCLLT
jgi:hypothetical protein